MLGPFQGICPKSFDSSEISSESELTIVLVINLDDKLASIVQAISGLPKRLTIFLKSF